MGFTPNYSIPYPEGIDPPDGAGQMKALAEQVDLKLKPIDNRVVALEDAPFVRTRKTAAQSLASGSTPVGITFPLKDDDPFAMADANGFQYTAKKAGIWQINATVFFSTNATGQRWVSIHLGGTVIAAQAAMALAGTWHHPLSVTTVLRLTATDVITIGACQVSGAALDTSAVYPSSFSMLWRRA